MAGDGDGGRERGGENEKGKLKSRNASSASRHPSAFCWRAYRAIAAYRLIRTRAPTTHTQCYNNMGPLHVNCQGTTVGARANGGRILWRSRRTTNFSRRTCNKKKILMILIVKYTFLLFISRSYN